MVITFIIILFALLLSINFFQLKYTNPGSDHFIHFAYIESIKANKNRFISSVKSFVNGDDFPDPQLFHWLVALLPSKFLKKNFKYFGTLFNILSFIFFLCFLYLLYPHLSITITFETFMLWTGVLYILTPFVYFVWNAKNVGLSARGFGLMLGHLFIYSVVIYSCSTKIEYLVLACLIAYLILLSSQFGFQFVIFFCVIASIHQGEILFVMIPIMATILFMVTFPKWSRLFFIRQWHYKRMYFKILSPKFGLAARYSVWRDFIFDFWKAFYERGLIRGFEYFYRNPIIELLIGFPAFTVMALTIFLTDNSIGLNETTLILWQYIGVSLVIFVSTSFRLTRFLGEPQRYVEFVFPLTVILPVLYGDSLSQVTFVLIPSVLIIIFELVVIKFVSRREGGGKTNHEKTMEMKEYFDRLNSSSDRDFSVVLSNNSDVLKYFAHGSQTKIVNINITEELTGGLHFNEIFPKSYGTMSLEGLLHLAEYFKVNYLILDEKLITKPQFENSAPEDRLKEVGAIHHFVIYKSC